MTESELLEKYKKEVSNIPEMRNLVSYRCEDALKIISLLISKYNKSDSDDLLMVHCLYHLDGKCSPFTIRSIIEEWKETE